MPSVAANVAASKAAHPELYCPTPRCLWRTGGGPCPRHGGEPLAPRDYTADIWAREQSSRQRP